MDYTQKSNNFNIEMTPSPGSFIEVKHGTAPNNEKWKKRLLSLEESEQRQIAAKYYGGHMPWKE